MKYRFYTCDVFTQTRFGGNPLAVLPHADGLTDDQMQQIAREFNYAESTFVFPPQSGHTRKVRIFTPGGEVPFAGHPNVGTAFVLASTGELGAIGSSSTVTFEEKAGLVPVTIQSTSGRVTSCEVTAPEPLSLGQAVPLELVAAAASCREEDIVTQAHTPQMVSVGLPFVMAEIASLAALQRIRANMVGFDRIRDVLDGNARANLYVYTKATGDLDLRARMMAPLLGVPEDPATGSASCAVAGLLAHLDGRVAAEFTFRIAQGVEMGRPSALRARAEKAGGVVRSTHVGGACVPVSEGMIEID